jgi:hypothetical protein
MRRVENLLLQIRRHTENSQEGVTDGISDLELIEALNNAQESMTSRIHSTNNKLLATELEYTGVSGQEEYELPFNLFSNSHIIDFSWAVSGAYADMDPLVKVGFKERIRDSGAPSRYLLKGSKVLVNRIPDSSGQLGVMTYNPRLPTLDKRSGQVTVATLNSGAKTITALTLSSAVTPTLANAFFTQADYLTVVDRDGVIKMKAIPIDGVNTSTGVVSVASGFVYATGETIAVGDYVCLGKYASTHSGLPETCERFLLMYAYKRVFLRDCSSDYILQDKELQDLMNEIVEVISMESNDIDFIPIINADF